MIAVDTSLLVYAVNRFAPEHARAGRLLEELVHGGLPWALPWPVAHEFLRRVTHPHAVARPLTPGDASGFIERVLASSSVQALGPTLRHWEAAAEVLGTGAGELPPGFEIAVILREHGVRELLSADRGMRRFRFLTVIDPLHGEPWSPTASPVRRYRVLRARPIAG